MSPAIPALRLLRDAMGGVTQPPTRPSHTTLAAGMVIGGSVGVVITVAEQLSGLNSLETRKGVADFLAEPPGSTLGLDVSQALTLLRVALMVVAGCATAAALLGWQVLKRNHRARIGLSVLAVPIFLGGLATGGILTSVVAASTLLLWIGPSGEWFRGSAPTPPGTDHGATRQPSHDPLATPPAEPPPAAAPPAGPPPGAPRTTTQLLAPPPGAPTTDRRPDALTWACVLTWACCGMAFVIMVVSVVLMATSPDLVLEELRRQNADLAVGDVGLLRATTYVSASIAGVWSVAAMLLAVLAYRRVRWARLALVVSAAAAAVLCLLAVASTLVTVVPAVVCVATVLLLNRPDVRAWFTRHDAMNP